MNRRAFLATIAAGLAAAADPDRLLWEPGKRKIFIPPVRQYSFLPEYFVVGGGEGYFFLRPDGIYVIPSVRMTRDEFKRRYPDTPLPPTHPICISQVLDPTKW